MWGAPGHAYVYFTYGMHHCLNVVTEPEDRPAAVLVRALEPTVGVEELAARRPDLPSRLWLSGPGRICRGLGIDRSADGVSLVEGPLWVSRSRRRIGPVGRSSRVGIRRGLDRDWRFYLEGHPFSYTPRGTNHSERDTDLTVAGVVPRIRASCRLTAAPGRDCMSPVVRFSFFSPEVGFSITEIDLPQNLHVEKHG